MAENKSFDRRIVDRNIKRGRITRKDYDQFLNGLEDVKDKAVPMSGEEDEGDAESAEEEQT